MPNLWITAWFISAVCAGGAGVLARRAGLSWIESLLLGSIFFPAPLFVAMGGGNSLVYAFDLAVPLAVGLAGRRWVWVPLAVKKAGLWLLAGVGVVPLLVAAGLANRECVLYGSISLYRLLGALSLMCVMSVTGQRFAGRGAGLLEAVSWINLVLVLAALAQSQGWIDSNVFYHVANENSIEDNDAVRFITAGLFRGSLGILGTLGWAAFLAQYDARGWRGLLALGGGAAGGLLIILCGSKTSLLASIFITVAACLLFRPILRHLRVKLAGAIGALVLVTWIYLQRADQDYFAYTLGVLGMSHGSLETFNYRQERWQEVFEFITREPAVLMGVATPFGAERGMGYFHNEYLGLLMSGGVWSAGPYLIGLCLIGRGLARRPGLADQRQVFGGLTLLAGLVQAATVNHVAPGIFFGCTAMIIACAYGLGLARDPIPALQGLPADDEERDPAWLRPRATLPQVPREEQSPADDGQPIPAGETAPKPRGIPTSDRPGQPILSP